VGRKECLGEGKAYIVEGKESLLEVMKSVVVVSADRESLLKGKDQYG